MPLVAAPSKPLVMGEAGEPPTPYSPPSPAVPSVTGEYSRFVNNHQRIIDYLDKEGRSNSCPTRIDLDKLGIAADEMSAHIAILVMNQRVVPTDDRYCTMDVIMRLKESLKRYRG